MEEKIKELIKIYNARIEETARLMEKLNPQFELHSYSKAESLIEVYSRVVSELERLL